MQRKTSLERLIAQGYQPVPAARSFRLLTLRCLQPTVEENVMRKTAIIVLSLALAACAIVVLAQVPGGPPATGGPAGMRVGMGMGSCPAMTLTPPSARMLERADMLQLSDDQKTKLNDVLSKGDQTLAPLREAAGKASRALRTAVMGSEADAQKIAQLVADAQKTEAAIINAEIQIWGQIKSVLSAEQMTKLQELLASRAGMGGGRNRNRPGPGAGGEAPPPPPPPGQ